MARRGRNNVVVQVLLTEEQVDAIDAVATKGRSAYVRDLLSEHLARIISGQEDHHVSTPETQSTTELITATLDRMGVPPGDLQWRLGFLEGRYGSRQ